MLRPGITRERLAGLCVLGAVLFSPAFISLFDRGADVTLFGVPVLLIYIFGIWAGLIALAAVLVIRRQMDLKDDHDTRED